jgi:hypothetical protein
MGGIGSGVSAITEIPNVMCSADSILCAESSAVTSRAGIGPSIAYIAWSATDYGDVLAHRVAAGSTRQVHIEAYMIGTGSGEVMVGDPHTGGGAAIAPYPVEMCRTAGVICIESYAVTPEAIRRP